MAIKIPQIDKILIEKKVADLPATRLILSRLSKIPAEIIKSSSALPVESYDPRDLIPKSKKTLLIAEQRGKFFKPCPGTKHYLCCLYKIVHQTSNCPIDCSYCILQNYFNNPYITFFANEEDMFHELEEKFTSKNDRLFRVGTGEFGDSLALEPLTDFTLRFIPFIKQFKNVFLELKTKSINIENVLKYSSGGRIFTAWSLNPQTIIDVEEPGSASLNERLNAARICQESGFPLCFHFDPIIRHRQWREEYKETISELFTNINPDRIVYISLGCLRFPPSLKDIISRRFPESELLLEEFIRGNDGKMRYFKPLRIEAFKFIYDEIRKYSKAPLVYLCMESAEIWRAVFGFAPKNNSSFSKMLDDRCKEFLQ